MHEELHLPMPLCEYDPPGHAPAPRGLSCPDGPSSDPRTASLGRAHPAGITQPSSSCPQESLPGIAAPEAKLLTGKRGQGSIKGHEGSLGSSLPGNTELCARAAPGTNTTALLPRESNPRWELVLVGNDSSTEGGGDGWDSLGCPGMQLGFAGMLWDAVPSPANAAFPLLPWAGPL